MSAPPTLAGPVNFRDLGGYTTSDEFVVRHGRLFRSDGLWGLTNDDVAHLVHDVGVRTVVDLRAPSEIERYGDCPLEAAGCTRHEVTFLDENMRPDLPVDGSWTLEDLYLFLVRRAADRVVAAITLLADEDAMPVVFHCTAGKDRTGVVAALVLALLGVPDAAIADDYAKTASVMPSFTERARAFLAERGLDAPDFSRHVYTADRDTILLLLASIRDEFGSVERWATSHGMPPDAIERLRSTLLERV